MTLMKPTAFRRRSPAWSNKHLLVSYKGKGGGGTKEDIQACQVSGLNAFTSLLSSFLNAP